MRPLLKPGLRRAWRDGGTLQIGLTPGRSLLLNGLDEAAVAFLAALDGARDVPALLVHAERLGVPGRQAAELLDMLTRAGLLDDAAYDAAPLHGLDGEEIARLSPDMASLALGFLIPGGAIRVLGRRRAAVVAVHGCGRVGASIATILAAAGVGCVVPDDGTPLRPADTAPAGLRSLVRTKLPGQPGPVDHRMDRADQASTTGNTVRRKASSADEQTESPHRPPSREDALRASLHAVAPSIRTSLPANRQNPDLAILAPASRWPQSLAEQLQRAGVPHLPAVVHETTATLGPFVQPGRTSCLRCRDLHRTDRDPGWPRVLAQLADGRPAPPGAHPLTAAAAHGTTVACDTVLATHLAAQAAMHALAFLEGDQPPSLNTSFDYTLPYGDRERRDRPPHPDCGCAAARF